MVFMVALIEATVNRAGHGFDGTQLAGVAGARGFAAAAPGVSWGRKQESTSA